MTMRVSRVVLVNNTDMSVWSILGHNAKIRAGETQDNHIGY